MVYFIRSHKIIIGLMATQSATLFCLLLMYTSIIWFHIVLLLPMGVGSITLLHISYLAAVAMSPSQTPHANPLRTISYVLVSPLYQTHIWVISVLLCSIIDYTTSYFNPILLGSSWWYPKISFTSPYLCRVMTSCFLNIPALWPVLLTSLPILNVYRLPTLLSPQPTLFIPTSVFF